MPQRGTEIRRCGHPLLRYAGYGGGVRGVDVRGERGKRVRSSRGGTAAGASEGVYWRVGDKGCGRGCGAQSGMSVVRKLVEGR